MSSCSEVKWSKFITLSSQWVERSAWPSSTAFSLRICVPQLSLFAMCHRLRSSIGGLEKNSWFGAIRAS
eukprot:11169803-Lingulodinium_polyedra.AAC.1